MLSDCKLWAFIFLMTLPIPLLETAPIVELWFEKKPQTIYLRWGREVLKWKREQLHGGARTSKPKIMKHEFRNGRSVFWIPALALADVGAMPSKEWPELENWMKQNQIRALIWRKSDRHLRDWLKLERSLPRWIETVWWISNSGKPTPERWKGQWTRRRWTTGHTMSARQRPAPRDNDY